MISPSLDNISRLQWDNSTIRVGNKGGDNWEGLGGAVIGNITTSIMHIGLSYRVDQASVQSIVSQGKPSIGQGIGIGTQAIAVRKDYRSSSILRGRGAQGNTNKGDKSKTLHVYWCVRQTVRLPC